MGEQRMSCPRGYAAPQDLKVGSGASSHSTPSLCLGPLLPFNLLLGEVGLLRRRSRKQPWCPAAAAPARSGRATSTGAGDGIVDPAPGSQGGRAAAGI